MKKVLGLALSVTLCLSLVVGCATKQATPAPTTAPATTAPGTAKPAAPAKTMKIGSVNAKARSLSAGMFEFGKIVEKESNGAIKVEVYTDGVLGDDRRTLEGLQMGSIQGTTVSTGPIASFSPTIGVFDLPFLFKDSATAYKLLDGPVGQELLDGLSKAGFIGLGYWENGFRHTTNSKKEITTLDDFKGLKIRVLESQIHIDIWKALGTNPTPMSFSQLYTAMEQKVVDGQENPIGNVVSNKFNEVQKYLTLDGHVYGASPFLISKVFWDTLSDSEKNIMKSAEKQAREFQRKAAAEEDKAGLETLKKAGMTISELKPGEKEKIRAAMQAVYDKNKATFGEALVAKILEATK